MRRWAVHDEEKRADGIRKAYLVTFKKEPGSLTIAQCERILTHRAQAEERREVYAKYRLAFKREPLKLTQSK